MRRLTAEELVVFATLLVTGCPVVAAVRYFVPAASDEEVGVLAQAWIQQPGYDAALRGWLGGEWHEVTERQRMEGALRKHYAEMAYVLWTTNYAESEGAVRVKADVCRQALEAKISGLAGREDVLSQFLRTGLEKWERQLKGEVPAQSDDGSVQ